MEQPTLYLTYDEYVELGGTLDETSYLPLALDANNVPSYQYQFVSAEVVIRAVTNSEMTTEDGSAGVQYWYKGNANDRSFTVYAYLRDSQGNRVLTNMRIDKDVEPFVEAATFGTSDAYDLTSENSPVGTTWHITGYLCKYFDKYQFLLPNNHASQNYLYKVS